MAKNFIFFNDLLLPKKVCAYQKYGEGVDQPPEDIHPSPLAEHPLYEVILIPTEGTFDPLYFKIAKIIYFVYKIYFLGSLNPFFLPSSIILWGHP